MFMPLKDDTPLHVIRFQYVTAFIIAVNIVIFLLTGPLAGEQAQVLLETGYGVVPSELLDLTRVPNPEFNPVYEPMTLFTYMFLHGGWLHLIGNMAFLWVFADNVEDAFGPLLFTLFYVICGVLAALIHVALNQNSHAPLVGASGAVSGIMAAYLLLYPKARVWILLFLRLPVPVPAWVALGGWILWQIAGLFFPQQQGEAVAFWAHIGGFLAGLVITAILRLRPFVKNRL
jgi:membrane associated rhomboid family serine protease